MGLVPAVQCSRMRVMRSPSSQGHSAAVRGALQHNAPEKYLLSAWRRRCHRMVGRLPPEGYNYKLVVKEGKRPALSVAQCSTGSNQLWTPLLRVVVQRTEHATRSLHSFHTLFTDLTDSGTWHDARPWVAACKPTALSVCTRCKAHTLHAQAATAAVMQHA